MTNSLLQQITEDRNEAQKRRKAGEHASAETIFAGAIDKLERELRRLRRTGTGHTPDICEVLEQLSQTYGSRAGNWRDAQRRNPQQFSDGLQKAVRYYDAGNEYEEERRQKCAALDSYNLLQRLVVRLLQEPRLLKSPEPCIVVSDTHVSMTTALERVREEIDRQMGQGRHDSWLQADRALVRFLCGLDADDALQAFENRTADKSFYESTRTVVASLLAEGLGRDAELGQRLEGLKAVLIRKGGLSAE